MTKKLAFSLVFVFSTVLLSAHTLTHNTQVVSRFKTESFALTQVNSLSCVTCEGGVVLTGTFVTTLNYFISLLTAFAAPVFLWFSATKMKSLLDTMKNLTTQQKTKK